MDVVGPGKCVWDMKVIFGQETGDIRNKQFSEESSILCNEVGVFINIRSHGWIVHEYLDCV